MSRFDVRTQEQFANDIFNCSKIEADIILRTALMYYRWFGAWPDIYPNGTDYTGEFRNHSNGEADFIFNNIPTEIMHSKPMCAERPGYFHIKEYKLDRCCNGEVTLIMVDGYSSASPKVTFINKNVANGLKSSSLAKYGGLANQKTFNGGTVSKPAYRILCEWMGWDRLPVRVLDQSAEKKYASILKVCTDNQNLTN